MAALSYRHLGSRARLALSLATAVAAASALAAVSLPGTAVAGETASTPGHSHGKKVYPTTANGKANGRHAAGAASGSGKLTYGGAVDGIGVTTGAPKVYLVFYGTQWGTAGTNSNTDMTLTGD